MRFALLDDHPDGLDMARALLATLRSHYEPLAAQSPRLPEIAERLRPWRGALLSASRLKRSTLAG